MESRHLHFSIPQKQTAIINRLCSLLHFIAFTQIFYYRLTTPFPSLLHLLIFVSEILLFFLWFLHQAYLWRPISRQVFPENLNQNEKELPNLDVFICTADPTKEPPLEVMNTVISAMALDYPLDKLHVYLSDDGGCSATLIAMREAYVFSLSWIPFCKRFGIETRCPKAYFSVSGEDNGFLYREERKKIEKKYEQMKESIKIAEENYHSKSSQCHPAIVEVIHGEPDDKVDGNQVDMPLLVYISREKRPSQPHYFKGGALNVLLRVSGILSNSSHILILDCDMYCNDPSSAKQAMCFHLDPKISHSLAFVQFPQKFHNISNNDIYDSQLRIYYMVRCPGMDGLQGPMLSGTGFYIKREALYGKASKNDISQLKQVFGPSNEFIKSLQHHSNQCHITNNERTLSSTLQQEAGFLASCSYEQNTQWGQNIGFWYNSLLEDLLTGFILHSRGWKSIYWHPSRLAFLGSGVTKLNDGLVQGTRWNSGGLEIALSKFSPPIYGLARMSLLQAMCYSYIAFQSLYSFPIWCMATLPQLCLLNGIPIYPQVSDPWFMAFSFTFLLSQLKYLQEVLITGGSMQSWCNEQRMWMIRVITCYTYGILDTTLKIFGMRPQSFSITNKAADDEQERQYQKGKFDFQMSTKFLTPLTTLVLLNLISFVGGIAKIVTLGNWKEMFGQVFISFYILLVSCPIIEGMAFRRDKGRVPTSITLLSIVFSVIFLYLGSIYLCFEVPRYFSGVK